MWKGGERVWKGVGVRREGVDCGGMEECGCGKVGGVRGEGVEMWRSEGGGCGGEGVERWRSEG